MGEAVNTDLIFGVSAKDKPPETAKF